MRALRRFRPLAAVLTVAVLVPMHGRTQEARNAAVGNDGRA